MTEQTHGPKIMCAVLSGRFFLASVTYLPSETYHKYSVHTLDLRQIRGGREVAHESHDTLETFDGYFCQGRL